jgi:protein-disulfide isomerase
MASRKDIKAKQKKKQKQQDLVPFLIIGGLVIIVLAIVIITQITNNSTAKANIITPEFVLAKQTDGLTMGDPNAKVTVIEFADFQCPYCGSYWKQLEPTIIQDYVDTGKILYVYHPFSFLGTSSTWDESVKSSEAAYCANDQGKFWEYRAMLFANQNGENKGAFSQAKLIAFAEIVGLDMKTFKQCLSSDAHNAEVTADTKAASDLGATFTPSFLVDGQIVGPDTLIESIDAALSK